MKSLFLVLFFFLSCGKPQTSKLEVINGLETDAYKSVVQIEMQYSSFEFGYCTATFIKPDTLLTATHCVKGAKSVKYLNNVSNRIYTNKLYNEDGDWIQHDTAIVKFDNPVSKYIIRVSTKPLESNDQVILVGYGVTDYDNINGIGYPSSRAKVGKKHQGFNTYIYNSELNNGIISFVGKGRTTNADGSFASLGQGDSGGALIVAGKGLIGVASAQALTSFDPNNFANESYYAYLLSKESKRFFDSLKAMGEL